MPPLPPAPPPAAAPASAARSLTLEQLRELQDEYLADDVPIDEGKALCHYRSACVTSALLTRASASPQPLIIWQTTCPSTR
eukprot:3203075-Prymnesium_polylepis.1